MAIFIRAVSVCALLLSASLAQAEIQRPKPRPEMPQPVAASVAPAPAEAAPALAAPAQPVPAPAAATQRPLRDPTRGSVTNLPLPRFVSLKGNEGNARRGPGLTHRIDWVFTRSGMPLMITAEYEHWRRVEDAEGVGGWVYYSLLSGVRSALVTAELGDFHARPQDEAEVSFQAERNVVGWVEECLPEWCRLSIQGEEGWIRKDQLWGVRPDETIE